MNINLALKMFLWLVGQHFDRSGRLSSDRERQMGAQGVGVGTKERVCACVCVLNTEWLRDRSSFAAHTSVRRAKKSFGRTLPTAS